MEQRQLKARVSRFGARGINWLRTTSPLIRVPLAVLLIVVGIIVPFIGIWMMLAGLVLVAQDVPFLRRPLARLEAWIAAWHAR
jgi:hypothetical protein